ncbi:MAG: DUF1329 domain-containing protein, partial [Candidatus Binatia bacterium]
ILSFLFALLLGGTFANGQTEPAAGGSAPPPETAAPAPAVAAAPQPGEIITKKDAERVRDLVSPGVLWLVSRGMDMKIIPYEKTPDPPAYREATEKYSSQVRLLPSGVLDENSYVAGRPFPIIDENDPQAAVKIMYNFERGRYFTDDLAARYFDAETGAINQRGGKQVYDIERHFVLDNLRILKYIGRTENEPMPQMPNPQQVLAKAGQFPVIEPFDLKGVGGLAYRYLDPAKHDDTWLYLPSLRRVRRLSSAQRSDALFGQDVDVDSYGGYAGQIPWFGWKLLGHKAMLGSGMGEHLPGVPCTADGGVTFCENWEIVPKVWIIEGTPKMSGYAYSKRVLFIDASSGFIMYTDLYDHGGELWKVAVLHGRFSTKPNPKAAFEYKVPRDFLYGFVMVDMQLEHGTRASLPGMGFPEEPGWYVNQGVSDEEWFTIASLIEAGR